MKRKRLFERLLAAAFAFILAAGTLYPSEPAAAFQDTYYGSVKIEEYNALSSFTEDGLTYIGGGAFWGCWYLEGITLPKKEHQIRVRSQQLYQGFSFKGEGYRGFIRD